MALCPSDNQWRHGAVPAARSGAEREAPPPFKGAGSAGAGRGAAVAGQGAIPGAGDPAVVAVACLGLSVSWHGRAVASSGTCDVTLSRLAATLCVSHPVAVGAEG